VCLGKTLLGEILRKRVPEDGARFFLFDGLTLREEWGKLSVAGFQGVRMQASA
jgi:hypothetical protein